MDVTGANIGSSELYGCTMGVPVFAERNRDDILSFIELCKLSHGGEVRLLCQWHNAVG